MSAEASAVATTRHNAKKVKAFGIAAIEKTGQTVTVFENVVQTVRIASRFLVSHVSIQLP
jgi:hypothetical protein